MGRNKSRDDQFFNCSDDHEITYVSGLYKDKEGVRKFLKRACKTNLIHYSRHKEVYELIKEELGYPLP